MEASNLATIQHPLGHSLAPARIAALDLDAKRVMAFYKDILKTELQHTHTHTSDHLGMVWLLAPHIRLGREAGWAARNVLAQRYKAR